MTTGLFTDQELEITKYDDQSYMIEDKDFYNMPIEIAYMNASLFCYYSDSSNKDKGTFVFDFIDKLKKYITYLVIYRIMIKVTETGIADSKIDKYIDCLSTIVTKKQTDKNKLYDINNLLHIINQFDFNDYRSIIYGFIQALVKPSNTCNQGLLYGGAYDNLCYEDLSKIFEKFNAITDESEKIKFMKDLNDKFENKKAKKEAEEKARKEEEEEKAKKEAEKKAKEAEEKARKMAEEQAKEAEEQAQKEAEEKAKAKEKAKAEEKAKKEAEEKAKKEAEEKAKEAEEKAKEAEEKAKKETEEKAKKEAEEKAQKEAEEKARKETEHVIINANMQSVVNILTNNDDLNNEIVNLLKLIDGTICHRQIQLDYITPPIINEKYEIINTRLNELTGYNKLKEIVEKIKLLIDNIKLINDSYYYKISYFTHKLSNGNTERSGKKELFDEAKTKINDCLKVFKDIITHIYESFKSIPKLRNINEFLLVFLDYDVNSVEQYEANDIEERLFYKKLREVYIIDDHEDDKLKKMIDDNLIISYIIKTAFCYLYVIFKDIELPKEFDDAALKLMTLSSEEKQEADMMIGGADTDKNNIRSMITLKTLNSIMTLNEAELKIFITKVYDFNQN